MMPTHETMEDRRENERFPILKKAAMLFGAEVVDATIFDVSARGAKVRLDCTAVPPAAAVRLQAILQVPGMGDFPGEIVWTDDEYLGLSFFDDHAKDIELLLS
ncbi:MAG: PilZ domain-containing protein [Rhodospirillales bacterium]|nr:PilZ domain-containing protein [Alphaproteobacteria bacterium]MBL6947455.1 PilZ domain-containing protein [Rhodospirillales bacterium]